jgi:hypothetical protein
MAEAIEELLPARHRAGMIAATLVANKGEARDVGAESLAECPFRPVERSTMKASAAAPSGNR